MRRGALWILPKPDEDFAYKKMAVVPCGQVVIVPGLSYSTSETEHRKYVKWSY